MKVLWVTNILFSHHCEMMGISTIGVGGSWLYAAYQGSYDIKDLQLHIVTVADVADRRVAEFDGNIFYVLPGGNMFNYDVDSIDNREEWERLYKEIKPDVVIIWGTEGRHSYLAMQVFKDVPNAIYVQGHIKSIVDHYYDGVPSKYITNTLRDYIDITNKHSRYNSYERQKKIEDQMFKLAQAVVVENDWCEDMCLTSNPNLKVFRNNLPIRKEYYDAQWQMGKVEKYSIFTNAGGYPIKGHHILLQALSIVKQQYPNFKCYIPGVTLSVYDTYKRRTGYTKYLCKLIKDGNLTDNIVFLGNLSAEQMAQQLEKCNVYVMPSIVENHSSSLIEAMIVGAPCVSSLVGGTASLIHNNLNGFLYNSLDSVSLAGLILRLFKSFELAEKFSNNVVKIREIRASDFSKDMIKIYNLLLTNK